MKRFTFSLLILLFASASIIAQPKKDPCVEPYIRDFYLADAYLLAKADIATNDKYQDSVFIPKVLVIKYVHMLTAAYRLNKTIFRAFEVRCDEEHFTTIKLQLDPKQAWAKEFFTSGGTIIKSAFLKTVVDKYGLKAENLGIAKNGFYTFDLWSPDILNTDPVYKQLLIIPGLSKGIGLDKNQAPKTDITVNNKAQELTFTTSTTGDTKKWVFKILSDCTLEPKK